MMVVICIDDRISLGILIIWKRWHYWNIVYLWLWSFMSIRYLWKHIAILLLLLNRLLLLLLRVIFVFIS